MAQRCARIAGNSKFASNSTRQLRLVSDDSWGCPPIEVCDGEALLPAVKALRETAMPADLSRVGIVCGDPTATPNDLVGYAVVDAYAVVKRAVEGK